VRFCRPRAAEHFGARGRRCERLLHEACDDGQGKVEEAIASYNRALSVQNFEGVKKEAIYLDQRVQLKSSQKGAGMKPRRRQRLRWRRPGPGERRGGPQQRRPGQRLHDAGVPGLALLWMNDRNFNCMGDEVVCSAPATGKTLWTFKLEGDLKKEGMSGGAASRCWRAALPDHAQRQCAANGPGQRQDRQRPTTSARNSASSRRSRADGSYVGTQDGQVVCIDSGDKNFTGWPCWAAIRHTGLAQAAGK